VTHKLLLADDSVTIQRVVELTFSGEDVQVVTVGDGEQAIARIPIELPDIVLADIAMPKRSGYDVAAFVKGRSDLSHIPVLLLAGAFEPVDENRAQQVHSDGVLVKPFEPQQVIARVRDLIESSQTRSRRKPAVVADIAVVEHRGRNSDTVVHSQSAVTVPKAKASVAESPQRFAESAQRQAEPQLDDYFDRLDAAFAGLGTDVHHEVTPQSGGDDEFDGRAVPTLESLLAVSASTSDDAPAIDPVTPVELSQYNAMLSQAPAPRLATAPRETAEPVDGRNLVADMFAALFAVEQGQSVTPATPFPAPVAAAPVAISDNLVDEVTRRVVERLVPEAANELVAQIVSEVAERLIREEITRIKAAAAARP
jgi:CheY-like chemotaxis protein